MRPFDCLDRAPLSSPVFSISNLKDDFRYLPVIEYSYILAAYGLATTNTFDRRERYHAIVKQFISNFGTSFNGLVMRQYLLFLLFSHPVFLTCLCLLQLSAPLDRV